MFSLSLFRVRPLLVALSFPMGFSAKPDETKSSKTNPFYHLDICVVKQDLWDHVAFQLVEKDKEPIYKSLCQASHFDRPHDEDTVESRPIEPDDFSKLFLHWYANLLRPILIGEPAVFEKDSLQMITQTFSIPLSKKEYQLALEYINDMDKAVREGRIGYVGLDRSRNFMANASRFIASVGTRHLPETLWPDAIEATEIKTECYTPPKTVFYNCATYVEGMLDQLGIAKNPKKLQESFCTWPSSIIKRAELASAPSSSSVIDG